MCGGGGIGQALGEIGGAILGEIIDPFGGGAIGYGLSAAAGAELGGTVGGVASGEPIGKALETSLPGAALSGLGAGIATGAGGGGWGFGAPADAAAGPAAAAAGSATPAAAVGGAAPAASAGGAVAAPGDWTGAFQPGDLFSGGTGPGSAALGTGAAASDAGTASAAGAPYGTPLPPNNTTGFISQSVASGNAPPTIPGIGPQSSPIQTGTIPTAGITPALSDQLATAQPSASSLLSGPVSITGGAGNPGTSVINTATGIGASASGGGAGGGTATDPGFLSNLTQGNFGAAAKDIPLGAVIGGGGLAYEALKGTPAVPNLSNLNQIAGASEAQSQALINAELSGQLPAGAAAGVQQGLESAQAAIRSQFASLGLSGSAQEAEALATAAQTSAANSFNIAAQMGQQGISLAGLPAQVYQTIMQTVLQSDQAFSNSIVNFATAAAGAGPSIRIGNVA